MESPVSAVFARHLVPAPPSGEAGNEPSAGRSLLQLADAADGGRVERVGLLDHHEPGGVARPGQHRVVSEAPPRWAGWDGLGRLAGPATSATPGWAASSRCSRFRAAVCPAPRADDQDLGGGRMPGTTVRCGRARTCGGRRCWELPYQRRSDADGMNTPGGCDQADRAPGGDQQRHGPGRGQPRCPGAQRPAAARGLAAATLAAADPLAPHPPRHGPEQQAAEDSHERGPQGHRGDHRGEDGERQARTERASAIWSWPPRATPRRPPR